MGRHSLTTPRRGTGRGRRDTNPLTIRGRINWPWRILAVFLLTAVTTAALLALMGFKAPATLVSTTTSTQSCFRAELAQALADIDPARRMPLVVSEIHDGDRGTTDLDTGVVRIDPDVPCGQLRGLVAHEWAHWMQHEVYGSGEAARAALPSVEVNADCVADLIAPGIRAYIGARSCTPDEVHAAKQIMNGVAP